MNPSKLRHRITLQLLVETQNDYGEDVKKWEDGATVWASINSLSPREFFAAEKQNSEITHKINLRYVPGILPNMRVKFQNRTFEIIGPPINYEERNIELQLLCKELF